jgi:WD40 repeat protein
VLTAGSDPAARQWDAATAKPLTPEFRHPGGRFWFAAFHPDGRTVVSSTGDDVLELWDAATGRMLRSAFQHDGSVSALAFSPDGKTVLTGSWDGTARLWDAGSRRPIGPLLRHPRFVDRVAYGGDGRTIVTLAGPTARCWRAPVPVAGDVDRVVLWVEVLTGMTLDEEDMHRWLDADAWAARRRRLAELGGPPGRDGAPQH